MAPDVNIVSSYLHTLQDRTCELLEKVDGTARFREDAWQHSSGGGGKTRILRDGAVFEQAGVGFSHVHGNRLPVILPVEVRGGSPGRRQLRLQGGGSQERRFFPEYRN